MRSPRTSPPLPLLCLLGIAALAPLLPCDHSLQAAPAEQFAFGKTQTLPPITLSPSLQQNQEALAAAETLSEILFKITGQKPEPGSDPNRGFVLATAGDLPELAREAGLNGEDPMGREDYLLRTSKDRLLILGATPVALERAVADLVHRMGYRQYFPGKAWEIIPRTPVPHLTLNEVQRPAYKLRDLFTFNYVGNEEQQFRRWLKLNRMGRGFQLNTRHAYHDIYKRHKAEFDANPDYFGYVNGVPQLASKTKIFKFNPANPNLLKLLVADARQQFAAHGEDSVSMDPSDFGGWDNSGEASRTIGSPSNQAVTMANIVAREAAAPLGKYVGMYAYYDHQFAPDIPLEPNIIVSFATRFLKPGQDLFRNIRKWQEKGLKQFGIRDYSSYWDWDLAMPGRALGGNLHYLKQAIERYHALGARFYTSENQNAWGAYGLGFYVTTRLLWNPSENPDEIVNDFLDKAFGTAKEPMAQFYSRLNGPDSVLARQFTAADLYAPLLEAMKRAEGDEAVERRIQELMAYVHYVELISRLETAPLAEKRQAMAELLDWVFRTAPMHILPTKAIALRKSGGARSVYSYVELPSLPELETWYAEAQHRPVGREELLALANRVVANRPQPGTLSLAPLAARTSSPWMRNSAAFLFPMKANAKAVARLTMRRFGFSGYPRYVITDPQGAIVARGELQADTAEVEIASGETGNYALHIEPTPNLIKCDSETAFCLLPTRDTQCIETVSSRGRYTVALPEGTTAEVCIGGQGTREKVNVKVTRDKETVAQATDVNGVAPLACTLKGETPGLTRYQIHISRPGSGEFEDQFFRFHGPYSCPVALHPNTYAETP